VLGFVTVILIVSLYIDKSSIIGNGLHTDTAIKKGTRVGVIHGPVVIVHQFVGKLVEQSLNWIGIGRYSWINTKESPFKFINHSCDPNTFIQGKRVVIALKNIAAGEEVTMDYSLTEADPDYTVPGGCHCGSRKCRKVVGPIQSLTKEEYNSLKHIVNPQFQRIYKVEERRGHTPQRKAR
jgi:uncharacterized protein